MVVCWRRWLDQWCLLQVSCEDHIKDHYYWIPICKVSSLSIYAWRYPLWWRNYLEETIYSSHVWNGRTKSINIDKKSLLLSCSTPSKPEATGGRSWKLYFLRCWKMDVSFVSPRQKWYLHMSPYPSSEKYWYLEWSANDNSWGEGLIKYNQDDECHGVSPPKQFKIRTSECWWIFL